MRSKCHPAPCTLALVALLLAVDHIPAAIVPQHVITSTASSSHTSSPFEIKFPINVHNDGGEVFREVITSNPHEDYISIDFEETDGSHIKQLIDFKNNIVLFRVARLGEQDLNEQKVQDFCFVTRMPAGEFVSSELMSQLTQRNPAAIRYADKDRGSETYEMDLEVDREMGRKIISPHLENHCDLIDGPLYASEADLRQWVAGDRSFYNLTSAIRKIEPQPGSTDSSSMAANMNASRSGVMMRCGDVMATLYQNVSTILDALSHNSELLQHHRQLFLKTHRQPCHCSLALHIPWYVCAVRYCQNPKSAQEHMIRCGIRSCRKRYQFRFSVQNKLLCLSDFDPTLQMAETTGQNMSQPLLL